MTKEIFLNLKNSREKLIKYTLDHRGIRFNVLTPNLKAHIRLILKKFNNK